MRIHCIFHNESTPSLVIYSKNYKCFGCGKFGPIEDIKNYLYENKINIPVNKRQNFVDHTVSELKRISMLPKALIRGVMLPYDDNYYYIMYPNNEYYKKRAFGSDKSKYLSPFGITKPLFEMPGAYTKLLIVEGELNAITANMVEPNAKIVSPGPCTDFLRYMKFYVQYNHIYLAFDSDRAGIAQAVKLRDELRKHGKFLYLNPMKKDFNDILTRDGIDAVRREVEKILGVSENL